MFVILDINIPLQIRLCLLVSALLLRFASLGVASPRVASLRQFTGSVNTALGCVHTASELAKRGEAKLQTQGNSGLSTITNTAYVSCRKFLLKLLNRQQ